MKKILSLILVAVLLFSAVPAYANDTDSVTVKYLDNGCYIVTIIEDASFVDVRPETVVPMATTTTTKSKTSYMKNAAGSTLWYVKVTGTFTYGDGSAKCTSVTPSAASMNSDWKVSTATGKKSGATASATATGKQYFDGSVINTHKETVTLTCSATGVFS